MRVSVVQVTSLDVLVERNEAIANVVANASLVTARTAVSINMLQLPSRSNSDIKCSLQRRTDCPNRPKAKKADRPQQQWRNQELGDPWTDK